MSSRPYKGMDSKNGSILDSILAAGLLFAIVFTAAAFGSVETWSLAIFELIIAILTALWILKCLAAKALVVEIPPVTLPILGLIAWGTVQTLKLGLGSGPGNAISLDVGATRNSLEVLVFMMLAFLLASNFFRTRRTLQRLAVFFSVYAVAMAVFALIQHFTWSGAYYWFRASKELEGFGPFVNRDHFAGYMEMLAPIPLALVLADGVDREKRALYGFATVLAVIAGVASLSRGGLISLATEGVFLGLWVYRSKRLRHHPAASTGPKARSGRLAQAVTAAAIIGSAGLGLLWIGAEPILGRAANLVQELRSNETSYISRQWIWRDTLSMIKAHPASGAGL
ncbi:MAG TPA: O-antigen ligase family protein, partial [Blastocatellia bacterium]|nr:O-antigen ligase family protein [Blastocatellia bacterium]